AEAAVGLYLLAVIADQVRCLFDVPECLQPVLPDLHAHQRRQFAGTVTDEVRGRPQQGDPFLPWRGGPARGGGCRGGDRILVFGRRGLVHAAHHRPVSWAHNLEGGATGAWLPADVSGERLAKP